MTTPTPPNSKSILSALFHASLEDYLAAFTALLPSPLLWFFKSSIKLLCYLGEYVFFLWAVLRVLFIRWPTPSLIVDQLFSLGVLSLPVVALTGFSTGLVLAAQSFYQLSDKGLTGVTGLMVTKAMLTELGPVLTAFMLTGRIGAAMCAEIGSMQVTEQIDAMRSMAVNPLRYLVLPRMIAGISMAPILTIFSMALGILGGYLLSTSFFKMTPSDFFDPVISNFQTFDLLIGIIKAFIFGLLIVSICCYRGMATRGGASGVGKMTTNSVVLCYTVILFMNFLLTLGLNSCRIFWGILWR